MFILEAPYVSDFLRQTILRRQSPTLDNSFAQKFFKQNQLISSSEFVHQANVDQDICIYSNSENAIEWIADNLSQEDLSEKISLFKDKTAFRALLQDMNPDYFFQAVDFENLEQIQIDLIPKPFIIKPATGFFSLGVHKVDSNQHWIHVLKNIKQEIDSIKSQYPSQVLNADKFIIEQCIEGEEFAVDVYFNSQGEPVILNILSHLFASENDVSDRVYITSVSLIQTWLDKFTEYLQKIGARANLKNFPAHVELRVDSGGQIMPIEVNPMRFAGWCVADLTFYAYGFNPYDYYLDEKKPDWQEIFAKRQGRVVGVVVADIAPDIDRNKIESVDYQGFASKFKKVLEFRRMDFKQYSVFAFAFVEALENDLGELQAVLGSDLKEFLQISN